MYHILDSILNGGARRWYNGVIVFFSLRVLKGVLYHVDIGLRLELRIKVACAEHIGRFYDGTRASAIRQNFVFSASER